MLVKTGSKFSLLNNPKTNVLKVAGRIYQSRRVKSLPWPLNESPAFTFSHSLLAHASFLLNQCVDLDQNLL